MTSALAPALAFIAAMGPVQIAQGVAALAWAGVVVRYAPRALRLLRKRGEVDDVFRAIVGFVGLTQIGFTVRWYIFPHTVPAMGPDEISLWLALYTLSAGEAVALLGFSLARAKVLR